MKRFEKHIFICENERPEGHPRGCCKGRGGIEVRDALRKRLKESGLNSLIRVNSSGCLDACEFGAAMVIYPEQVWYGGVKAEDVEEIVESHLKNNVAVDRLKIQDKRFNRDNVQDEQ
jgi:(2Fe-2S) ferredoxin